MSECVCLCVSERGGGERERGSERGGGETELKIEPYRELYRDRRRALSLLPQYWNCWDYSCVF